MANIDKAQDGEWLWVSRKTPSTVDINLCESRYKQKEGGK